MIKKYNVIRKIIDTGVVAILRSETEDMAEKVSELCLKGGINIIEITFSVPNADKVIQNLKLKMKDENIVVGAGTVLEAITARTAILSGADFIVSPIFNKEVAMLCNMYSVPYIPGCMTVNEIVEALKYGVDIVKLFPANQFSPQYIKSIKTPLPQVNVMVTGGVNIYNAKEWIESGASAIGIGGDLTTVKNNDYSKVKEIAEQYIGEIRLGRM